MMWSERIGKELYVYRNGELVYKAWIDKDGKRRQSSILFNNSWPNEWIAPANRL
jgi:hypothetical protein